MEPIRLLDIASQKAQWLSVRQAVIAANVANANTPGYTALDVRPFAQVLDAAELQMAVTNPAHMALVGSAARSQSLKPSDNWEVTNSGNSVGVEQQMMHAGEINRAFALNSGILKAFHGMFMSSVKS